MCVRECVSVDRYACGKSSLRKCQLTAKSPASHASLPLRMVRDGIVRVKLRVFYQYNKDRERYHSDKDIHIYKER